SCDVIAAHSHYASSIHPSRVCDLQLYVPPLRRRPALLPYTTLFRSCSSAREPELGEDRGRVGAGRQAEAEFERVPFEPGPGQVRSEEHTSELQSRENLVCRLLLERKHPWMPTSRRGRAERHARGERW